MPTFGGLRDNIIEEIGKVGASLTAIVELQIQNAVEFYANQVFWFNEGNYTFTTSSSQAAYPWPSDFMAAEFMQVSYGGANFQVEPKPYQWIAELDNGKVFSVPAAYAMFNQNFRLFPVPNASYTIVLDYQKRLPTLSVSTDSNAWTTYGQDLIIARVEKVLHARKYRNPEMAQMCAQAEQDALTALRNLTHESLGSGKIFPSD